jgi:proliferating cell nuclear antigen
MSEAALDDGDGEHVVSGIVDADTLAAYVDTLRGLVDEAKLHFGDGGIQASAVDPANVAMWQDTRIAPSAFESFDSPGEVVQGVNLTRLSELLDGAASGDLVEFGIDMESRKLDLRYRGIEHAMGLIDPDSIRQEPDSPDLDLPNHVVLSGGQLTEAIDNCELTSDHLWLRGDPDAETVTFAAEGDIDETVVTYPDADCERFDIDADAESVFSINYLVDMVSEIPTDAAVAVHFGDEFPAWFEYDAFDGGLEVIGLLAPRIQTS